MSLVLFEEITEDLTPYERETVLPLLVRNFQIKIKKGHVGKDNAVNSGQICDGVNLRLMTEAAPYRLTSVKVRKLMGAIRQTGMVANLCSSSRGYYVAANAEEVAECIESLKQRIRQQTRVVEAMEKQANKIN